MTPTATYDIGKLAGLLEGEAWFGHRSGQPRIQFGVCDLDVVQWVADLLGVNVNGPLKTSGVKAYYRAQATGARAAGWMMTVYKDVGLRRRGQIRAALTAWRAIPPTGTYTRFAVGTATHCIHGHILIAANVYTTPRGGHECRTCRRDSIRRHATKERLP